MSYIYWVSGEFVSSRAGYMGFALPNLIVRLLTD